MTFSRVVSGRVRFDSTAAAASGDPGSPGSTVGRDRVDVVGYVTQHDYLLPFLTPRETLAYAAALRLPGVSLAERAARVEAVVLELGLRECAGTLVGDQHVRGISGGEKRRVSVGIQMLSDPAVLCMDEPTSGLDAFTANNLVVTLARLAAAGKSVICSVHQPRSDIFAKFGTALLLARGRPTYCGRVAGIVPYFEALGHACPPNTNPADFVVDVSSVDPRTRRAEEEGVARIGRLVDAYRAREEEGAAAAAAATAAAASAAASAPGASEGRAAPGPGPADLARPQVSWPAQAWTLTARFTVNWRRDFLTVWGGFLQALVLGLVVGAIFFQLPGGLDAIRSRYGLAYITISAEPYILLIIMIERFTREMKVFDREMQDAMYSPSAYVVGHLVSSLPQNVIQPLLYAVPIYFMSGLRLDSGGRVVNNLVCLVMLQHITYGLAWVCVSLSRQFSVASLIGNTCYTFIGLSSGFLVNFASLPVYVNWIRYVSFGSWSFRLLMTNEFSDNSFGCPYPAGSAYCQQYDGNWNLGR